MTIKNMNCSALKFGLLTSLILMKGTLAAAVPRPAINPSWAKVVADCQIAKGVPQKSHLWIFKQWHLPPSINTHNDQNIKNLPQQQNQSAIFNQLDSWISASQIHTVFAEGCSGTIDENFATAFNGWTIKDLIPLAHKPHFEEVTSHVPLKLEAKFRENLETLCADDESLIKQQNLAFSDARGIVNFLTRLNQFHNDPKRVQPYVQGVIELYHLPATTSVSGAIAHLKKELSAAIKKIDSGLNARNLKIAQTISAKGSQDAALVIGGLHAAGLMQLLPSKGIGCTVLEPSGYEPDAEKSMVELRKI